MLSLVSFPTQSCVKIIVVNLCQIYIFRVDSIACIVNAVRSSAVSWSCIVFSIQHTVFACAYLDCEVCAVEVTSYSFPATPSGVCNVLAAIELMYYYQFCPRYL
jgi:hypothetical protein